MCLAQAITGAAIGPGSGTPARNYLFLDDFTRAVPEANPLTSPRTTTGGQVALITDTDAELSITAANGLVFAGNSPIRDNPVYVSNDAFARTNGVALYCKLLMPTQGARDNNNLGFGWNTDQTPGVDATHMLSNDTRTEGFNVIRNSNGYMMPWSFDTSYVMSVVLRANGAHHLVKGGAYTNWSLIYTTRNSTASPLYICRFYGLSASMPDYTRWIGAAQLAEAWLDDSFYLHSDDTPTADDTATASADGTQYIHWTAGTDETLAVYFRRTDDNNTMVLRCSQAGSTMKIVEIDGGGETELSSQAYTFTATTQYRIAIQYNGGNVKTWVNDGAAQNNISGATYNQAVTGIKVAGFASAQYWQAWPYSLTGAALTELATYAPEIT